VQLPWSKSTSDQIDIAKARAILDEDHYDSKRSRTHRRVLAVGKLKNKLTVRSCASSDRPASVKTSLGQSIAKHGRKFVRLSVGGVRDEAEIRGHRRTYIGAMPGTIVRALRDAAPTTGHDDRRDRQGRRRLSRRSAVGAARSARSEQNNSFRDHYLDLPLDLSRVLFICTANTLDSISSALRDPWRSSRSRYTEMEKLQIAKRYLVPKQKKANG